VRLNQCLDRRERKIPSTSHTSGLIERCCGADVRIETACRCGHEIDWNRPPKARKLQRRIQLAGELARGALNSDVFALYEPPAPTGLTDNPDRRAAGRAEVIEADD